MQREMGGNNAAARNYFTIVFFVQPLNEVLNSYFLRKLISFEWGLGTDATCSTSVVPFALSYTYFETDCIKVMVIQTVQFHSLIPLLNTIIDASYVGIVGRLSTMQHLVTDSEVTIVLSGITNL